MNKFLTYAGTQPVFLGDVDFMQAAVGSAFTQMARALMDSGDNTLNAILQGVEITHPSGTQIRWTAGVVVIDGEILPIASGTAVADETSELYFHVSSALSGERTFKDGESHECYDTRSAYIDDDSTDGIAFDSVPRLHEEVVVDDHVYNSVDSSLYLVSGRLVRKSGLWFIDAVFSIPDGVVLSPMGSLTFSGLSVAHRQSIDDIDFPVDTLVTNQTDGSVIQPMFCSVTKNGSTVQVVFMRAGDQAAWGDGRCRALIPIF